MKNRLQETLNLKFKVGDLVTRSAITHHNNKIQGTIVDIDNDPDLNIGVKWAYHIGGFKVLYYTESELELISPADSGIEFIGDIEFEVNT